MKTVTWITPFLALLLGRSLSSTAQIGAGDTLGRSTIPINSSIGTGDTLGASSIPICNVSLTTCGTALPVDFLDFSGQRENGQYVGLEWKTTNEIQNAGFWVQRSFDNTADFKPVFFVPALNNTDLIKLYQTQDTNAYRGTTYYRLQQADLDGNTAYSRIIAINGYPTVDSLDVYPNPSHGMVFLRYPMTPDGRPYEIRVYTALGQMMFDGRVNSINLSGQPGGVYIIECLQDKPQFAKIVLLK